MLDENEEHSCNIWSHDTSLKSICKCVRARTNYIQETQLSRLMIIMWSVSVCVREKEWCVCVVCVWGGGNADRQKDIAS